MANRFNPLFKDAYIRTKIIVDITSVALPTIPGMFLGDLAEYLGFIGQHHAIVTLTAITGYQYIHNKRKSIIYMLNPDEIVARKFERKIDFDPKWADLAAITPKKQPDKS